MLTVKEYEQLRDQYKGHSVGTKFRKLIGRYNVNSGSLEKLNDKVARYIRSGGGDTELSEVHDAIHALAQSPAVEKYGKFLAELLMSLPERPQGAPNHELMNFIMEAQRESAYRMFVQGAYEGGDTLRLVAPTIAWKKGAIQSTKEMLQAWREAGRSVVGDAAAADVRLTALRERVENPSALQTAGRTALSGGMVVVPTKASDRGHGLLKRAAGGVFDVVDGAPDMYELGRAGASGFSDAQSFSLDDMANGDLHRRLEILNNPNNGLDQPTQDYFVSMVGFAFSCLGVARGLLKEIQAGLHLYNARKLNSLYGVVPFGNATAAVRGVRELLKRYAAEQAAMGGAEIVSGVTSLAGAGPIGGVAAMGIKILIRIGLALRDAEEVIKARQLLEQRESWKDSWFVFKAMSDVPLFAAYYVMSATTSDLVGFFADPKRFNITTFQKDVEAISPQLTFLRNLANTCQMNSTWGLAPMAGWMECLDTRWYKQLKKEAYNAYQEFKIADTAALGRRRDNIKAKIPEKFGGKRELKSKLPGEGLAIYRIQESGQLASHRNGGDC